MRVVLKRKDDSFHFEGQSEGGHTVQLDGSPKIGGHDLGVRPMELVLIGLGGCSGIDVISILKKQRQPITDLSITVDGERGDETPAVFRKIHVHFDARGDLEGEKMARAVELSMEKYCSVAKMLENTAQITHSFAVNGVAGPEGQGDSA